MNKGKEHLRYSMTQILCHTLFFSVNLEISTFTQVVQTKSNIQTMDTRISKVYAT